MIAWTPPSCKSQKASQLEMCTLTYRRDWRLRVPLRVCQLRGVRHDGWKSRTLMVREIKLPCARRFSAPYSPVDCSKLHKHTRSGRPATPSRDRKELEIMEISWKSVEITRKSGNLLKPRNWKSVEITWKSVGNNGLLETSDVITVRVGPLGQLARLYIIRTHIALDNAPACRMRAAHRCSKWR